MGKKEKPEQLAPEPETACNGLNCVPQILVMRPSSLGPQEVRSLQMPLA